MHHHDGSCSWCGSPIPETPRHEDGPARLCHQCDAEYRADVERPAALFEVRLAAPAEGD